jgi:hypothetical protein
MISIVDTLSNSIMVLSVSALYSRVLTVRVKEVWSVISTLDDPAENSRHFRNDHTIFFIHILGNFRVVGYACGIKLDDLLTQPEGVGCHMCMPDSGIPGMFWIVRPLRSEGAIPRTIM